MLKMTRYCLCGAAMKVRAEPDALVLRLTEEFEARHTGEGHEPVDAMTAWRARRREEEQLAGGSTKGGTP